MARLTADEPCFLWISASGPIENMQTHVLSLLKRTFTELSERWTLPEFAVNHLWGSHRPGGWVDIVWWFGSKSGLYVRLDCATPVEPRFIEGGIWSDEPPIAAPGQVLSARHGSVQVCDQIILPYGPQTVMDWMVRFAADLRPAEPDPRQFAANRKRKGEWRYDDGEEGAEPYTGRTDRSEDWNV